MRVLHARALNLHLVVFGVPHLFRWWLGSIDYLFCPEVCSDDFHKFF